MRTFVGRPSAPVTTEAERPWLVFPRNVLASAAAGVTAVAVLLLGGGVGGWASVTQIAGAVIAPGTLVVDSHVKNVQHSTGGVVAEIDARDGDRVKAGVLLLRLDRTVPAANLAVVSKALDQLTARKARLNSERRGSDVIIFPEALLDRICRRASQLLTAMAHRLDRPPRKAPATKPTATRQVMRFMPFLHYVWCTSETLIPRRRPTLVADNQEKSIRSLCRAQLTRQTSK